MAPRMMMIMINTFLLLLFLLLIPFYSSMVQGFKDGSNTNIKPIYSPQQPLLKIGIRKLAMVTDAVLDYEDAGANPRHDPRRRFGGGRPIN